MESYPSSRKQRGPGWPLQERICVPGAPWPARWWPGIWDFAGKGKAGLCQDRELGLTPFLNTVNVLGQCLVLKAQSLSSWGRQPASVYICPGPGVHRDQRLLTQNGAICQRQAPAKSAHLWQAEEEVGKARPRRGHRNTHLLVGQQDHPRGSLGLTDGVLARVAASVGAGMR